MSERTREQQGEGVFVIRPPLARLASVPGVAEWIFRWISGVLAGWRSTNTSPKSLKKTQPMGPWRCRIRIPPHSRPLPLQLASKTLAAPPRPLVRPAHLKRCRFLSTVRVSTLILNPTMATWLVIGAVVRVHHTNSPWLGLR